MSIKETRRITLFVIREKQIKSKMTLKIHQIRGVNTNQIIASFGKDVRK